MGANVWLRCGIVAALLACASLAGAQSVFTVRAEAAREPDGTRIEFTSTARQLWTPAGSAEPQYLRFVLYRPHQSPPEFRIESWTFGREGCCHRLVRARHFDIVTSELLNIVAPNACAEDFAFGRWLSATSFSFRMICRDFVAEQLQGDEIRLRLVKS
ncbi:hypothetical protein ACG04R_08500 [Roseateles sp. BYS78W]|uniref:META domain-containing protein n=1 Tax=Pelomonas candidula TaxID=3299025 RepID=A0ABW7H9V9_9BURK